MLITDKLTNKVYFSKRISWYKCWNDIEKALKNNGVEYELMPYAKDIWVRDFMPIQTDTHRFADYVYRPDYLNDCQHLRTEDVFKCHKFDDDMCRHIDLKIDGGNVIKCNDKVIMTNKVFKENNNLSQESVTDKIKNALGVSDVVIIPWDKEEVYGHADGMVRFVAPGHVLINNYCDIDKPLRRQIISALTPYFSNISELSYGKDARTNSWAHLNFLRVGNIIFVPILNIPSDGTAIEQIGDIYKECKIVPVMSDGIVRRGGALNCVSWNIKI